MPPPAETDVSLPYDVTNLRNYSIAVSGDVFRWIIDYGNEEVLKRARNFPCSKLALKLMALDARSWSGFCANVTR